MSTASDPKNQPQAPLLSPSPSEQRPASAPEASPPIATTSPAGSPSDDDLDHHFDLDTDPGLADDAGDEGNPEPVAHEDDNSGPIMPQLSGELAPMPEGASPGFWGSIPYFFRVVSARYHRRGIVSNLKWEVRDKERIRGDHLHDLGECALPDDLRGDIFAAPLASIKGLHDRLADIRSGQDAAKEQLTDEDQRFEETEKQLSNSISAEQQRTRETQAVLTERSAALRIIKNRLTQEQKQLRIVQKQLREQQKTLEKTEDPGLEIVARQTVEQLETESTSWERRVANTEAEIATEQEPVDEISAKLEVEKKDLRALQNELSDARQALATFRRGIESEEAKRAAEVAALEQELRTARTKLGTVINEERPATAQKPPYDAYYGVLDQQQTDLAILLRKMERVDDEREDYDRSSYNKGLILLLSSTAASLLLIAILVLAL